MRACEMLANCWVNYSLMNKKIEQIMKIILYNQSCNLQEPCSKLYFPLKSHETNLSTSSDDTTLNNLQDVSLNLGRNWEL